MSKITVTADINSSIEKTWEAWNSPEAIKQWCSASDDWGVPSAENDLREGGKFCTTMAAKDGSFSFDFSGTYTKVIHNSEIHYTLDDSRTVEIHFQSIDNIIRITETFEAESQNPIEMQQAGWQAILNNFKKFIEQQ